MTTKFDHLPVGLRGMALDVAGGDSALLRHYGQATGWVAYVP